MIDESSGTQTFQMMRRAMVDSQLRTNAVNDPRVLAAMAAVRRELHVPADKRMIAYIDRAIPLGGGRSLNPPIVTGRLLTEVRPAPGDRVLLVGAATGYTAAVLAELAGEIVALESDPALLAIARSAGVPGNVEYAEGPLQDGWPAGAPYDLIFVDGAIEAVPPALVAQLAENGRLATALIDNGVARLAVGQRAGGGFGVTTVADAESVRLPGFAPPSAFRF